MHQLAHPKYRAAVIGAGPAGLACVGNLLDKFKSSNERILWIDPHFKAGRLENYPEVPSNTKVCLFTRFAEACDAFSCKESATYNKLLKDFDPQAGCKLKWAAELCKELTAHIKGKVDTLEGQVETLKYDGNVWKIETGTATFESKLIFLATGSKPKNMANASDFIDLDDALNPLVLESKIDPTQTIAVYGSSHSAMLVLKNLLDSPNCPARIVNFYRQEAKFAEFPDPIGCPDKILHDNTGLKGETAQWVRTWINLDDNELASKFDSKLLRIKTTANTEFSEFKIDKSIFAIGYERNSLPSIIYASAPLDPNTLDYTATGQLTTPEIPAINGLYGFGIAFPERVKDLDGSEEMAVGLWKFMRHIKKSIEAISLL